MVYRILGPLAVEENGRSITLGGPRQRALLAILLLHRGEVLPADRLIEELYRSDPPASARTSLRAHISRLRRALGPGGGLHTRAGGYVLDLEASTLDSERFEELLEQGKGQREAGNSEEAAITIREALALWRGPALAEFTYEDFAQREIARLEGLRLAALEERIDADLALGRHAELVGELERMVSEHPLRERSRAQLMLALYRSGRQADALETYRAGRLLLSDELGLEPGKPLRELERAILRQDSTLDLPTVEASLRARGVGAFVGRRQELEELRTCLDDALAGRGRLVLIEGEPGIGKSRLADEVIDLARQRGAHVLVGRCWEAGGAPAFWPWVQSLRAYVRWCDPTELREQLSAGASDLAQLLPEFHELFPNLPPPPSAESEGARFRLFDAVTAFLAAASRARPLVLALDDLHAADESSLLLLRFLARELGSTRLLLICTYRDVDPSLRDPLVTALSELVREPVTLRMRLDGIAVADVAEYIALTTGVEPHSATASAIHAETDGNPLFVGEIVRLFAAEGQLAATDRRLRIPPGVHEVIGSRIRRLTQPCQLVLAHASVLGREFALDALGQLCEARQDALLTVLGEAVNERVVEEVPETPGRLRFEHVLIRETLYDTLTPARRLQLHLRAGEALEHVYQADLEAHLAEVALHFVAAAPLGTRGKATDYARRAGERAVSLLAFEEAARLYELALAVVDDDADRCELLLARGEALARAGETPAANESFLEAAALAEKLELPEQLARAALGYGGRILWEVSREDEQHIPLLERALTALGESDSTQRVKLLARLAGGPLRDARFSPGRREEISRQGLEMARRIGDPATLAYALHGLVEGGLLSPDRALERLELSAELVEAARAAGEKEPEIEAHEERFLTLLSLGDRRAAEDELALTGRLAEELRQPAQRWMGMVHRALLALLDGRLSEAEELVSEARRIGERTRGWNVAVTYGLQLFMLRREQGRLNEIAGLIRDSADRYPTYVIWQCVRVAGAVELGDEAVGRAELEALAEDEFGCVPFDEEWLVGLSLLSEAAFALDDRIRAASLYRLLLPFEGRVAVSYPEISTGSVARYLGLLATTQELWDDAGRHFETALEMNEQICARPWLARTQYDYGAMLLRRDDLADRKRARELQRSARALADEMGIPFP